MNICIKPKPSKDALKIICPTFRNLKFNIIKLILKAINKHVDNLSVSEDELVLILDEAITNAMEHGNKWSPEKNIYANVKVLQDHLILSIADEGDGFQTEVDGNKNKELLPRGYGIHIINSFCEAFWNEKGNEINMKLMYNNV